MTDRAKECAECKRWRVDHFHTDGVCLKGHRPRYYKEGWCQDDSWDGMHHVPAGWRRRCEDFEEVSNE